MMRAKLPNGVDVEVIEFGAVCFVHSVTGENISQHYVGGQGYVGTPTAFVPMTSLTFNKMCPRCKTIPLEEEEMWCTACETEADFENYLDVIASMR